MDFCTPIPTTKVIHLAIFKQLVLITSLAGIFTDLFASNYPIDLKFKNLNTSHGLSNSSVGPICQDNLGFIWIATSSGLNRYDGYSFKVFRKEPGKPQSIASNDINKLFADSQGFLWILFKSEGLSVYEPDFEKFRNYYFIEKENNNLTSGGRALSVLEDRKNNLWLGTTTGLYLFNRSDRTFRLILKYITHRGQQILISPNYLQQDKYGNLWMGLALNRDQSWGVLHYNIETHKYRYFGPDSANKSYIGNQHITNIQTDKYGKLWFSTIGGGLKMLRDYRPETINTEKIQFNEYIQFPAGTTKELCNQINTLFLSSENDLWVLTAYGLFRLKDADPVNNHFEHYTVRAPLGILNELIIGKIAEDKNGNIWIGSFHTETGLCLFNEEKREFRQFLHNPNNEHSIAQDAFNSLLVDKDNIMWIGTKNKGISQLDLGGKKFETYTHIEGDNNTISSNQVYGITEDASGNIWVGTENGLNKLDPKRLIFKAFYHKPGNISSINQNSIFCLYGDNYGKIWIGYFWMQMSKFDPVVNTNFRFIYNPSNPGSFNGWSLRQITEDKTGNLWIASGEGLFVYNRRTNTFYRHLLDTNRPFATRFQQMNCVFIDSDENILAGSTENGLYILRKGDSAFINLRSSHIPSEKTPSDNYINCIAQSENGIIWLGTQQGGLNSYDMRTGKFVYYTTQDGLSDNFIKGIIPDGNGKLWISTNNGLSVFDFATKHFKNYFKEDGIQGNEFNICSFYKSRSGKFYFGGMNGLSAFYPDSIVDHPQPMPVMITDLFLFNQRVNPGDTVNNAVVLEKSILLTRKIILHNRNNFFSLAFAALNYASPQKIKYRYKLDDFEKHWNHTDASRRTVTYTNIPHGHYTFMVCAYSGIDQTDTPITKLEIIILPPWWKTWWFRIVLTTTIIMLLALFYVWRVKELKSRQKGLEKLVNTRTNDLLHANRLLEEKQEEILRQTEEITGQRDFLQQQNQTIETISTIGKKITSSIVFQDILERVYLEINTLIDAPEFSIGILDAEHQKLDFKGFYKPGQPIENFSLDLSDPSHLSLECIRYRKRIIINNTETDFMGYNITGGTYLSETSHKSMAYLPLISIDSRIIGVLIVKSFKRNSYTEKHILFLENIATYITIALENARLYKELEEKSEKLKQLDLLKTRFFINISHELRTPLTLILEPTRKMIENTAHFTSEYIASQLRIVHRNANRLLYLINQILDARKVETGSESLNLQYADLAALVTGIAELFTPLAHEHKIEITTDTPAEGLFLWFDTDKIEKTITNLLSNALKHTHLAGKVSVTLIKSPQKAILEISDTGDGIPDKDLPYIFNRFYQAGSPTDKHFIGSGIGLSIVKDYVELHKGAISVASTPSVGTIFTIELPILSKPDSFNTPNETEWQVYQYAHSKLLLESTVPTQDRPAVSKPKESHKKRSGLLIVEDNVELRDYLAGELSDTYEVSTAENGKIGHNMALELLPDIIVCDVLMPVMTGIELCEKLKNDERTSHIPILLLTAQAETYQQIEGLVTGADDYITKPFNLEVLKAKLNTILKTREALRSKYSAKYTVNVSEITVTSLDENFLKKAITLIEERITDAELNVDTFIENLGISRTNLFKKIKSLTGFTLTEFIRDLRLKRAAQYLRKTDLSISEIIYQTGFKSRSYFIQCFREKYNALPTEFRKLETEDHEN